MNSLNVRSVSITFSFLLTLVFIVNKHIGENEGNNIWIQTAILCQHLNYSDIWEVRAFYWINSYNCVLLSFYELFFLVMLTAFENRKTFYQKYKNINLGKKDEDLFMSYLSCICGVPSRSCKCYITIINHILLMIHFFVSFIFNISTIKTT